MNTLHEVVGDYRLNAYMEEERHRFIQAAPHERSDQRQRSTQRATMNANGPIHRHPTIVHARCSASLKPSSLNAISATNSLLLSMMEMVVNGVSTRKVTKM